MINFTLYSLNALPTAMGVERTQCRTTSGKEGSRRRQFGAKGRERENLKRVGRFGPRRDMRKAGESSVTLDAQK